MGGNTDLVGGAIVSESDDLTLDTGTLTTISGDIVIVHDTKSCAEKLVDAVYHQFIGTPFHLDAYAAGLGLGALEQGEALAEIASDPVALGGQLLGFAYEVVSDPRAAALKYGEVVANDLQVQANSYLAAMANEDYEEAGRIGSGLAVDIAVKVVAPAAGAGLAVVSASSPIGKLADRLTRPGGSDGLNVPNGGGGLPATGWDNWQPPAGYVRHADGTVTHIGSGQIYTPVRDAAGNVRVDSGGNPIFNTQSAGSTAQTALTNPATSGPTITPPVPNNTLTTNVPTSGRKLNQLTSRGWDQSSIDNVVNSPVHRSKATNRATGNPATAYFDSSGN